MSRSTDPGHFFQTSDSLAETNRKKLKSKNNNGFPLRLQSKILAIIAASPHPNAVFIAESVGIARRIVLDDPSKSTHIYHGPSTPLTCLALSPNFTSHDQTLFAGCWDKTIWSWSTTTTTLTRRYTGHTDFVTSLLYLHLPSQPLLISGSSDTTIIIFSVSTGQKLHTLHDHTRGILSLAIDPITYPPEPDDDTPFTLFSASSDRSIRRWNIHQDTSSISEINPDNPLLPHDTSIYALHFSPSSSDDLFTASADGTSKCLPRTQNFSPDTTFPHTDYVRAVATDESGKWVITAGRDENVKVWDRASGKLYHTYVGHYEEVTGLVVMGDVVVSVSIDATVRRWSLRAEELRKAVREAQEARDGVVNEEGLDGKGKAGVMTEEEEKELEQLMGDSE